MAGNDLNRSQPVLDYTTADAASIIADMSAHAQAQFADRWTSFHPGGIAVVQRDLQAYQFDLLMFYLNALLNETFSSTALRRNNLMKIARGEEYPIPSAVPYAVTMRCVLDPAGTYPATIQASDTVFRNITSTVVFTPIADTLVASYPGSGFVDIVASQGSRITAELLGTSNAARDQAFKLAQIGLLDGTLEVTVGGVPWTQVFNIVNSDASDEEYMVLLNDRGEVRIQFGDGQYGKVPPLSNQVRASYRVIGPSALPGAVARDTINQVTSGSGVILSASNPADATGGGPPPSVRQIRAAIPANRIAQNGLLRDVDVAAGAQQVPGVAKARAEEQDVLFRRTQLAIAPVGGGLPSASLKSLVSTTLREKRGIGFRIVIVDPVYKDVRMSLLVHAERNAKRDVVKAAVQQALINDSLSGFYDFDQVDFAGLDPDDEDNVQVSVDRLNEIADQLRSSGVKRLEVRELTVVPDARRLSATSGDGTVTGVVTPTNDHLRREYVIRFTSAFTFVVRERITGTVTELQTHTLYDDKANFENLLSEGFTRVIPDRSTSNEVPLVGNTQTLLSTDPTSTNLFELTEVGAVYAVERDVPGTGSVGVPYSAYNAQGAEVLAFTVNVGASAWTAGDTLVLDTFAPIQDVILRSDEIPRLLETNLDIQVSGGVA